MLFAVWCVERGKESSLVEMPLQKSLFLFRGVPETGLEGTSKDVYGGQAGQRQEEEQEELTKKKYRLRVGCRGRKQQWHQQWTEQWL